MSYTIEKTFTFEAAHRLPKLPKGHKCRRLHGHSYKLTVRLTSKTLDDGGMVVEYGALGRAVESVVDKLDHRYLNKIPGLKSPTTEILAHWIFRELRECFNAMDFPIRREHSPELVAVIVHESTTTCCEYRP